MFRFLVIAAVAVAVFGAPKVLKQKPKLSTRIVGGQDADIKDLPYQLSLLWASSHICGASILNETWAVTAAHCTDGSDAEDLQIRANSSILEEGGQVVQVKAIHQNPDFDYFTIDHDISLLELAEAIKLGDGAQPIALQKEGVVIKAGSDATVSGWGTLHEGDWDLPTQLQVVVVPIVSNEDCADAYSGLDITDRMLCAGVVPDGGKDACQGDSGGPLVVDGLLSGLTSWGYGCAEPGYPGVYSNVSSLRSFVTEVTGL